MKYVVVPSKKTAPLTEAELAKEYERLKIENAALNEIIDELSVVNEKRVELYTQLLDALLHRNLLSRENATKLFTNFVSASTQPCQHTSPNQ